jgi:hypothetical protein
VAKRNVHLDDPTSTQMPSHLARPVIGIATDPRHLSLLGTCGSHTVERMYTMYHYYQQSPKLHIADKTRNASAMPNTSARYRYTPSTSTSLFLHVSIDHNRPPQGSTLKFSLMPIAASSTSKYLRTPGTATCVTSSPPAHFWPDLSSQQSFFGSSPLTL